MFFVTQNHGLPFPRDYNDEVQTPFPLTITAILLNPEIA